MVSGFSSSLKISAPKPRMQSEEGFTSPAKSFDRLCHEKIPVYVFSFSMVPCAIRDFFPEWWDDRSVVVLLVLFFIGLFLFGLDILDE